MCFITFCQWNLVMSFLLSVRAGMEPHLSGLFTCEAPAPRSDLMVPSCQSTRSPKDLTPSQVCPHYRKWSENLRWDRPRWQQSPIGQCFFFQTSRIKTNKLKLPAALNGSCHTSTPEMHNGVIWSWSDKKNCRRSLLKYNACKCPKIAQQIQNGWLPVSFNIYFQEDFFRSCGDACADKILDI